MVLPPLSGALVSWESASVPRGFGFTQAERAQCGQGPSEKSVVFLLSGIKHLQTALFPKFDYHNLFSMGSSSQRQYRMNVSTEHIDC